MEVSAAVYETIAVLAEVSLVWSLGLLGRGIKPLRAAHTKVVASLEKAADLLPDEQLPASLRFGVWLNKLLLKVPLISLVASLAVLGGLAFSPESTIAKTALLVCICFIFLVLLLFTFFNRQIIYGAPERSPIEPAP
jgi:hypothetical protein